ncbi:MAG: hypothetical protein HONDAALG_04403 [Gammaproteobacteria bacterium]|nr:hypothetical protein [Gammaproteobacteria bacterium]
MRAVGDHHRAVEQQRLEGRGAGDDQRRVRGREHLARATDDVVDGEIRRHPRLHRLHARRRLARQQGHHHLQPGHGLPAGGGREQERRGVVPQLAHAAAGQQREQARVGGDSQPRAGLRPGGGGCQLLDQRMPDALHRQRVPLEVASLEGKQRQHQVDAAQDGADPALAPGPHARADIVNRGDPRRVHCHLYAEVELRRVDPDEDVRAHGDDAPRRLALQRPEFGIAPDDLRQAHDREAIEARPGLASRGAHPRPGDALGRNPVHPRLQGVQQARRQKVSGGFARYDGDAQHRGLAHLTARCRAWRPR